VKNGERLYDYGQKFASYLEKYSDVRNLLLEPAFFSLFSRAINSDVFGGKRHE